jgi:hypothetical protein
MHLKIAFADQIILLHFTIYCFLHSLQAGNVLVWVYKKMIKVELDCFTKITGLCVNGSMHQAIHEYFFFKLLIRATLLI